MPADTLRTPRPAEPFRIPLWLGWIIALVALVLVFFMSSRLMTLGTEVNLARTEAEISRAEAQDLRQRLEAEQILATQEISTLQNSRAFSNATLARLAPPPHPAADAPPPPAPAAPAPLALLVWQEGTHEGILWAEQLPPLPPDEADEEYRVWLAESDGRFIPAATLAPGPDATARTLFRTENPLALRHILVTRGPKQELPPQISGDTVLTGGF